MYIQVFTIGNYYPYTLSCFGAHIVFYVVWLKQVHRVSRLIF